MPFTSGTIILTGNTHAVTDNSLDGFGPASQGLFTVSGTFTTAVTIAEKKVRGSALWLPLAITNEKTLARTFGSVTPTDSTTASYRVDLAAAGAWRVWVTSGTVSSGMLVELASGATQDFGGQLPNVYTAVTSAQSFGEGISFTGATTANTISIPDNLADALNITESTNSYIKFVTTNAAETVVVTPLLTVAAGISFTGATGVNLLKLADNLASALDITEAANSYLKFTTTDAAELVTIGKNLLLQNGVRVTTGGATAITTTRAVTRADSGGNFTVAQSSAYTVTVAQPLAAGEKYLFQCVSPGAFDVSIVATGCTFEGTITIDAATIPATGTTLKFATGAAVLGDNIELVSTSTTKFFCRAIASGAGGITVA